MAKENFNCIFSEIWKSEINREFHKIIKNRYDCLDHFAINLILPNHPTINICSNPTYISNYKELGMQRYSSGLFPELIKALPVVPWRLLLNEKDNLRLNKYISFKEGLHGLYSGMSFVHKVDDIHLNVAVASICKNPKYAITFLNNAEDVLNLGAYFYEVFKQRLASFYNLNLPTIDELILTDDGFNKIDRFSRDWHDKLMFIL